MQVLRHQLTLYMNVDDGQVLGERGASGEYARQDMEIVVTSVQLAGWNRNIQWLKKTVQRGLKKLGFINDAVKMEFRTRRSRTSY